MHSTEWRSKCDWAREEKKRTKNRFSSSPRNDFVANDFAKCCKLVSRLNDIIETAPARHLPKGFSIAPKKMNISTIEREATKLIFYSEIGKWLTGRRLTMKRTSFSVTRNACIANFKMRPRQAHHTRHLTININSVGFNKSTIVRKREEKDFRSASHFTQSRNKWTFISFSPNRAKCRRRTETIHSHTIHTFRRRWTIFILVFASIHFMCLMCDTIVEIQTTLFSSVFLCRSATQ